MLLLDERFYHMFAYPAYFAGLALLLARCCSAARVNGAKAWFEFGFVPPAARRIREDRHGSRAGPRDERLFPSINRPGDLFSRWAGDLHPALSSSSCRTTPVRASCSASFLFVLYREGLQQRALHSGAADRRAVHRLVPARP